MSEITEEMQLRVDVKEVLVASYDALESSIHYFNLMIGNPAISAKIEEIQELLIPLRSDAQDDYMAEFNRVFHPDSVESN